MSLLATRGRTRQLALVTERRHGEAPELERRRREHNRCSDGGRLTLEQQLARVWEGLHAAGVAVCPLCGGRMSTAGEAGRCDTCGTTLT
jgi:tRNA(Ile2) C34 agmatinyltransferase TiaS